MGVAANIISRNMGPSHRPPNLVRDLATRATEGPAKMVLVVRTDLGMQKGKIAAQCAHAAVICYKKALAEQPKVLSSWETLGQTKVSLRLGLRRSYCTLLASPGRQGLSMQWSGMLVELRWRLDPP